MNIGSIIRDVRKQKGLTQSEFADRCEITQTYLSLIEGNKKEPNLATLKVISKKLDLPLPILFFLSMTDEDVTPNKREAFQILRPSMKSFVNEFFVN
ncbi:MAG: helix-turn-helix domain-containing protein [Bacteroidota bacterium]